MKHISFYMFILIASSFVACQKGKESPVPVETIDSVREIWTKDQANDWYKSWGWLRGSDFIPSTAVNQLEMWQAESFDTATINRELGWAESIGLNSMRVYLHHAAWEQDREGFKQRVDQYLTIAAH